MPDTLRIGLLGPLQVRDGTGHAVHVGGRQLRVLLILLALQAGRIVPAGSLAGQIWPEESPANPGNALQTLISRLRAVRLLRDRAVAVRPDFELYPDNMAAVARICRTLDGMPLAIELAAVWLRALTPGQLAERLNDRFTLLTGGSRTALPSHRTLRAVVD